MPRSKTWMAGTSPAMTWIGGCSTVLACFATTSVDQIVKLRLGLRAFQGAGVPHDFLVRITVSVELDVGLGVPFRIGNEFVHIATTQQLFGNASLLLDHQRSAFFLP